MVEPAEGTFADAVRRRPPPPRAPAHGPDPAAVAAAYELGEVRAPLQFAARGELGRIWRLETSTGSWAIKELLSGQTEDAAARDVAFQSHALDQGVRMPVPQTRPDGAALAEVPCSDGGTRTVRAYTWVQLAAGPRAASPTQAAEQLGRLHSRPLLDDRAMDPWFQAPVEDQRWTELLDAGHAADAAWVDAVAMAVPELVRANRVVTAADPVEELVSCHLDYNPMNVLLDQDGQPVVVDWENSGPAPLDQELASAISEFARDPADVPAFLDAYLAAGGAPIRLTMGSFTLTLAVQAHLVAFYARRSLDARESPENRQRGTFWVQDICEHLFTVDQVEGWLAAAAPILSG